MDALKKTQTTSIKTNGRISARRSRPAANDLLKESKKAARGIYKEGMHKMHDAEDSIKEYSDELLTKVQKNPLASVLIAAGVGYILSAIFRK